ncbi:MAG: hypothetical protein HZB51_09775 [Chloroflexi bacterium]|nr:hypothetical protein [Chloroflexota bacterium]
MLSKTRFFKQGRIIVGMLALALALLVLLPATASARFSSCRSDPIVYLSDGSVIVVTLDIATDVTDVEEIKYSIHVPKNVTLTNVIHTPFPGFTGKEKFEFKDDTKPGEYRTESEARTYTKKIEVTVTSSLDNDTKVLTGLSGQTLKVTHRRSAR